MLSLFESGERLFKITSPVLTKIQGKNFHSIPVFNQRRSLPLQTSFHLCCKVIAFLVKMQIILIIFYFGYGGMGGKNEGFPERRVGQGDGRRTFRGDGEEGRAG